MKRDPSLTRLSHDHQHGLAAALQLRRATADTALAAKSEFRSFWEAEGQGHFRAEEEILLPAAARHVPAAHEAMVRVLVEHVELRRRAADLMLTPVPELDDLHALGDHLHQHIRYEERILFPLIEDALPDAELGELADCLERADPRR
jgi:iron-sulfur cluster repair protein YtfE (RIC family)